MKVYMNNAGPTNDQSRVLQGIAVVPGVVNGSIAWFRRGPELPRRGYRVKVADRPAELERFHDALDDVATGLREQADRLTGVTADVIRSSVYLVTDRGWVGPAELDITAGMTAEAATGHQISRFIELLERRGGFAAERTADLRDIRDRIARRLQGIDEPSLPKLTSSSILVADELAPADIAAIDPNSIGAIATIRGGLTGHIAIVARQLGIPYVTGVMDLTVLSEGTSALLDGVRGLVIANPPTSVVAQRLASDERHREQVETWSGPAQTRDKVPVSLLANVQDENTIEEACHAMVDGVGLFRTELCFINRSVEPSVDEQAGIYEKVFRAFGNRVAIRTLDSGSDKPLKFAHTGREENPALGMRGVRIGLQNEDLLIRQLDAIAEGARQAGLPSDTAPRVMAPMISRVSEARRFAAMVRERGLVPGIVVEVPATAIMAEMFMREVDFCSIGTNDLIQYTMAADRLSADLFELTDPWQPAGLRLINSVIEAAKKCGKTVSICGESASDPYLAQVFVGMGVDALSMAPSAVPEVGVVLEKWDMHHYQELSQEVLKAEGAHHARRIAADFFAQLKEDEGAVGELPAEMTG